MTRELNVRKLLKETYSLLFKRHNPQEIVFSRMPMPEIANDSDWHRTRTGHMEYESAGIFNFNGKNYCIARGEACGGYPADPYDSDILALEFELKNNAKRKKTDKQIREELYNLIDGSDYFKNSLLHALANGNLGIEKGSRFGEKMFEIIKPKIESFTNQKPEYDREVLTMDLRPVCKKEAKYKPGFVKFLANSIESVLSD